jgi:hypothetical protein
MAKTVYVLNGPNLNLLGKREPKIYGRATLRDVEKLCRQAAARHKLEVEFRQSNHEGEIVDSIHEAAAKKAAGIVINPGAYTHQQHLRARALSPSFPCRRGGKGEPVRLRRRRLCARHRRVGRADRRAPQELVA